MVATRHRVSIHLEHIAVNLIRTIFRWCAAHCHCEHVFSIRKLLYSILYCFHAMMYALPNLKIRDRRRHSAKESELNNKKKNIRWETFKCCKAPSRFGAQLNTIYLIKQMNGTRRTIYRAWDWRWDKDTNTHAHSHIFKWLETEEKEANSWIEFLS